MKDHLTEHDTTECLYNIDPAPIMTFVYIAFVTGAIVGAAAATALHIVT